MIELSIRINNKVSLKQERPKNFIQDCENKILEILFNFGPQTVEQIKSFFQLSEKRKELIVEPTLERLTYNFPTKIIEVNKDKYYMAFTKPEIVKGTYNTESFQKSLTFLKYLLQLRDNDGKFIYYKNNSINYAFKYPENDNFQELAMNIMNMKVDILYCSSYDIEEYNEIIQSSMYQDKHILISDEFLDIKDVFLSESLLYLVTIDDNNKIIFLK